MTAMRFPLLLLAAAALGACAAPEQAMRARDMRPAELPPIRVFDAPRVTPPARPNAEIARDFLDLSFTLESGRPLPVFTRFEGPIALRLTGAAPPPGLEGDLARLLGRLRGEAGIEIARVAPSAAAQITVELVPDRIMRRAVPEAACFVVPRVGSWEEFRAARRSDLLDWATLARRERLAMFVPADVAPQEMRDCLHEELAQALGPLNDLYRLDDSVFNDDNFHTVLTGFDMLILRATYAAELRSGMTRAEVASRLPRILARLNPRGERPATAPAAPTTRAWKAAIEQALGPQGAMPTRRRAAARAIALAEQAGWDDNRLAFSYFALGRLTLDDPSETALAAFLKAGLIYAETPATRIHEAHIAMQLAAFALGTGHPDVAVTIVDANTDTAIGAENAALLSSLLLVKAEAIDAMGRPGEARRLRREALGWGRYGFGAAELSAHMAEIASIAPERAAEAGS
ncbi:Protein of unknown function (DUF2927) [Palleronia aestuarii]|uniref:ATP-dependent transcriptional regulator n=1 Tax=Palleronia aestuarii TaxID=568105 RepID=A0A2W7NPJ1_9RHOB|nr:DUF2927 domain-containing protein [Palleronia aestuarii]PZX18534.1 Protein of unknown function (DUF2927) [Palleronia aestuarii]